MLPITLGFPRTCGSVLLLVLTLQQPQPCSALTLNELGSIQSSARCLFKEHINLQRLIFSFWAAFGRLKIKPVPILNTSCLHVPKLYESDSPVSCNGTTRNVGGVGNHLWRENIPFGFRLFRQFLSFRGTNWRAFVLFVLGLLLKSSCKDSKFLLTHLKWSQVWKGSIPASCYESAS